GAGDGERDAAACGPAGVLHGDPGDIAIGLTDRPDSEPVLGGGCRDPRPGGGEVGNSTGAAARRGESLRRRGPAEGVAFGETRPAVVVDVSLLVALRICGAGDGERDAAACGPAGVLHGDPGDIAIGLTDRPDSEPVLGGGCRDPRPGGG